jgi:hypothetical protein
LATATQTVGGRNTALTPSCSTASNIASTLGEIARWFVAPTARAGTRKTCICAEWYSGSECRGTSRSESSRPTIALRYSWSSARWVIMAPLGRDVVPEV